VISRLLCVQQHAVASKQQASRKQAASKQQHQTAFRRRLATPSVKVPKPGNYYGRALRFKCPENRFLVCLPARLRRHSIDCTYAYCIYIYKYIYILRAWYWLLLVLNSGTVFVKSATRQTQSVRRVVVRSSGPQPCFAPLVDLVMISRFA
jgi:hypothetical protein